jgi:oxygen-independent coproporphyrinogen-3 oxidase
MAVLRDGGVSRISMGAQSFDPGVLKRLERLHRPERVAVAIDLAAEAGIERRSIDLIYAVPGQTEAMWANDLRTALALPIDHVSAYNLTYEPNTALTARLARGEFVPADEDIELVMFEMARDLTREAGLDRYEVSNYARPGGASRHNLAYWRQEPWIAAGPSASGHLAGWRWKNTPRLDTYLAGNDGGFAPAIDIESPDPVRALAERIMTGLRLDEGVDGARALAEAEALSPKRAAKLRRVVERHIDDGRFDGARGSLDGRWVLGESGILIADGIAADCIGVLLG